MKRLFIFLMLGIFLLSFTSALEFDNIKGEITPIEKDEPILIGTKNISYSPLWEKYQPIEIENAFGLGETLFKGVITNHTEECITDCESVMEVEHSGGIFIQELYTDRIFQDGSREKIVIDDLQILVYQETKELLFDDYEEVCDKTNTTDGCLLTKVGNHTEIKEVWNDYKVGQLLDKGNQRIKIKGTKKRHHEIDWVIKTQGEYLTEWASWKAYLSPGLVSWWTENETAGTNALDMIGGNDMTASNARVFTSNVSGIIGSSADFSQGDDYLRTTNMTLYAQDTTGAISFWVYLPSTAVSQIPWAFATGSATETEFYFQTDMRTGAGQGRYNIRFNVDGSVQWQGYTPTQELLGNTGWQHVVITHNGTAPQIWWNGTKQDFTFSTTTDKTKWLKALLADATTDANRLVLGYLDRGSAVLPFNRYVDEFAIYNRSLNSTEIGDLYNSHSGTFPGDVPTGLITVNLNDPTNKQTKVPQDAVLNVTATDPDGYPLNISFYSANTSVLIGTALNVASGSPATTTWKALNPKTDYYWYVNISNNNSQSLIGGNWSFTTVPWTSDLGIDVPINDTSFATTTYTLVNSFAFNTSATQTGFGGLNSYQVERISGPAGVDSDIYMRIDVDGITIVDELIRTLNAANQPGVSGSSPFIFNVSNGNHTLDTYFRRTGAFGGTIALTNIDFSLGRFETTSGNTTRGNFSDVLTTYNSVIPVSVWNKTMNKDVNTSTFLTGKFTINASGATAVTCKFVNGGESPYFGVYIPDATSSRSVSTNYITEPQAITDDLSISCFSSAGQDVTLTGRITEADLKGNDNFPINHNSTTLTTTNFTNTLTLNAGTTNFVNMTTTIMNGTNILMASQITVGSTTGAQTPTFYFNITNSTGDSVCSSKKSRYLSSNSDIGNIFMYKVCEGLDVGDVYTSQLTAIVGGGETATLYDEGFAGFENTLFDTTTANTPPIPVIINPVSQQTLEGTINVTWEVTDPQGDTTLTNISVTNVTGDYLLIINQSNSTTNHLWNTLLYLDGTYNMTITSCENATTEMLCGNSTVASISIANNPPGVKIFSPTNTTYTTTTINLDIATDGTEEVALYSINGGSNITFVTNTTFVGIEGKNNIRVWANNSFGLVNYTQVYFTIDTTAPTIVLTSPSGNYELLLSGDPLFLNWSVSDSSGVDSCWYIYEGLNGSFVNTTELPAAWFDGNHSTSGSLANGNYTFTMSDKTSSFAINFSDPVFSEELVDLSSCTVSGGEYNLALNVTGSGDITYTFTCGPNILKSVIYNQFGIHFRKISELSVTKINYVNCSLSTTTFNYLSGFNNLTFFANDTVGNQNSEATSWTADTSIIVINETYNSDVAETSNQGFEIVYEYNSTTLISIGALLWYDGAPVLATTTCSGTICTSATAIDIPLVTSGAFQTKNFFWQIAGFTSNSSFGINTTINSQNVSKIYLQKCNATVSTTTLTFTSFDEADRTAVDPFYFHGNWEFWTGSGTIYREYNVTEASISSLEICIKPAGTYYVNQDSEYDDAGVGSNYTLRNYYLQNDTINATNEDIGLGLLLSEDSTSFILKVLDDNLLAIPNALVYTQRYYPGIDTYETVQVAQTGTEGSSVGFFKTETVDYRFIIRKGGKTLLVTEKQKITPEESPFTLTFVAGDSGGSAYEGFEDLKDFSAETIYNVTTKLLPYTWTDSSGSFTSATLQVFRTNNSEATNNLVCSKSSVQISASLICDMTGNESGTYIAQSSVTRGDDTTTMSYQFQIETFSSTAGRLGLFLGWMVILLSAFIFKFNEIAGIIMVNLTIIIVNLIGLVSFGWTAVSAIAAVSLVILVLLER